MADAVRIERVGPPADTSADNSSADSRTPPAAGDALTVGDTTVGTIAASTANRGSNGQQVVSVAVAPPIAATADQADDEDRTSNDAAPYAFRLEEPLADIPEEPAFADAE